MGRLLRPNDSADVIMELSMNELLDLRVNIPPGLTVIGQLVGEAALAKAKELGVDNKPRHFKIYLKDNKVRVELQPLSE